MAGPECSQSSPEGRRRLCNQRGAGGRAGPGGNAWAPALLGGLGSRPRVPARQSFPAAPLGGRNLARYWPEAVPVSSAGFSTSC